MLGPRSLPSPSAPLPVMVFTCQSLLQESSTVQSTLRGGSNSAAAVAEPLLDSFLPGLAHALNDFLYLFPFPQKNKNARFPPLDDHHFQELCVDVYLELIRRSTSTLDDECSRHILAQAGSIRNKDIHSQRLAWLPTNIFIGLARDVYLELFDRFPCILQSLQTQRVSENAPTECEWSETHIHRDSKNGDLDRGEVPDQPCSSPTVYTPEEVLKPPLDVFDALIYLDSIKHKFQGHPKLYNTFLNIVNDFDCQSADISDISHRVATIFADYPALVEGFFLPPLYPTEYFLESTDPGLSDLNENSREARIQDERTENPPCRSWSLEPFSKDSPLCLDGQITRLSKYVVASGGYADVWTGLFGDRKVAIKIMRAFSSMGTPVHRTKLLKRLWREYVAWSQLHHENILECLGFSYAFTPQSEYEVPSLISSWMSNGTILSYLETRLGANVDRRKLLVGIAIGLSYLHTRQPAVVHGDLRAGNVLVSDTGTPCLTDFGLSRITNGTRGLTTTSDPAGSLRWMSPELLHEDKTSRSSDVWAYGMTVLEILTGQNPYNEVALEPVVLRKIIEGDIPSRLATCSLMTDEFWGLCLQCWHFQPMLRPSMQEIVAMLKQ